jgi:hypothetical protein
MRGIVIEFSRYQAGEYRGVRTKRSALRRQRRTPRLELQIGRITALLEELEGIAGHSSEVPSAMLARARAGVCKAEQRLGLRDVAQPTPPILEEEGDPQPHVDREALERLYHLLDSDQ